MVELVVEPKPWGNSFGIRVSKKVLNEIGFVHGEKLRMSLEKKKYDIDNAFGMWKGTPSFKRERGLLDRF